MPDLSADTVAQIIATVVIGIIAVAGAVWGVRVGAKSTRDATTTAIAAQQQETLNQRRHEDRVLIRALATECRFNAITLRQEREYKPDPRFMVLLRQSALDAATAALAALPEADRTEAQNVLQDVLWFNQLVTTRMASFDERGDTVARALVTELHDEGAGLAPRLEALADRLDSAAADPRLKDGATD
jgi:hypothetical protein